MDKWLRRLEVGYSFTSPILGSWSLISGFDGPTQPDIPIPAAQSLAMDPSSFQVLFNTLHPPEDHTFVPGTIGGKIPGFVYGQAGSSNADLVEPIPYDFDPAQFISALSSQLPQVEDESPLDQRIGTLPGGSGYTPDLGEQVTRKGKGKANGEGEGSKIVKVTWWRPHGAVSVSPGLGE
jgi:hypothetical protein